ncbi:MAG: hypothetical protein IKV72_01600 [Firmicutes bacterium]|nr:hypothetical protein [Bacillota bacterium]MBR5488370.1 hypothetical protein [Bacillota bacterium]
MLADRWRLRNLADFVEKTIKTIKNPSIPKIIGNGGCFLFEIGVRIPDFAKKIEISGIAFGPP